MNVSVSDIKGRPFIHDSGPKEGQLYTDLELFELALEGVDKCQNELGVAPPVSGEFINWMKEAVQYCRDGGDMVKFKQMTIHRDIDHELIEKYSERQKNKILKGMRR